MSHIPIALLCLIGFTALLLAMARHQQDWLKRKLRSDRALALRIAGFTALAMAYVAAGTGLGWAYGTVAWFGWMTVSACLTVVANTYREPILAFMTRGQP